MPRGIVNYYPTLPAPQRRKWLDFDRGRSGDAAHTVRTKARMTRQRLNRGDSSGADGGRLEFRGRVNTDAKLTLGGQPGNAWRTLRGRWRYSLPSLIMLTGKVYHKLNWHHLTQLNASQA